VCAAQVCAAQVCAAQVCVAQVCAAQVCAAQVCAAQVKHLPIRLIIQPFFVQFNGMTQIHSLHPTTLIVLAASILTSPHIVLALRPSAHSSACPPTSLLPL